MEDAGSAGMHIVPTFDGFERDVDRGTGSALTQSGRRGGKLFGDSAGRSVASSFTSHIRRAAALGAGILAGAAVKNFLGDSLSEARDSLQVGALTTRTIKSLGSEAGITAKHVGSLATELSHKSAIDDELIQSGENVLLVYKNVRNEVGRGNDVFDRSARAATNMAAALASQSGGTPNIAAASKTVGKALSDPLKGLTALRKANVVLTQGQQDQVKSLVAQGDTLGAQKVLLSALEDRYRGAAESQKTMGQEVDVAWGNIEEKLGKAILPLVDDVEHAILTKGLPVVRHWVRAFEDDGIPAIEGFADVVRDKGLPMVKRLYDKGKPLAEEVLPAMGTALGVAADALGKAAPYATDMVDAFNNAPDWVKKGTVFAGLAALAGKKLDLFGGGKGGNAISNLVSGSPGSLRNPLYVIQVAGKGAVGDLPGDTPTSKSFLGKVGAALAPLTLAASAAAGAYAIDKYGNTKGNKSGAALAAGGYAGDGGMSLPDGNLNQNFPDDNPVNDFLRKILGKGAYVSPQQRAAMDAQSNASLDQLLLGPLGHRKKISAQFDLLGLVEADAKMQRFRRNAEKPIQVPVVAKIDNALANLFGDAFGASGSDDLGGLLGEPLGGGRGRSRGGVNINIGSVRPHNYREFMGDVQRRSQQANLGGRP